MKVKKGTYNMTLNQENVAILKERYGIDNLSGWVDEKIREATYRGEITCPKCKQVSAPATAWESWNQKCPECKTSRI